MQGLKYLVVILATAFGILFANFSVAFSEEPEEGRIISPYLVVLNQDTALEQIPLKSTRAEVDVSGVIALVNIEQLYENTGATPIEAMYVFPGSTKSAVHGMTMQIGERVVKADIMERQKASATYNAAKRAGKSTALLEQHRPNVFQTRVANILPGDKVKIEITYSEILTPTDGIYEFIYPTVVGPRYSNVSAAEVPESEQWVANPYVIDPASKAQLNTFDIALSISSGVPIEKLGSSTHKVNISYQSDSTASITLDPQEAHAGDRDFILRFGLKGAAIESGLLLQRGEKENFFMLVAQPPERVKVAEIPAREYIFVVDVSGSMNGFPLNVSKELILELLNGLRVNDKFNILFFAGASKVLSPNSLPATPANIQRAVTMLSSYHGGGATELLPALQRALALPADEEISRSFVIATDGYVRVEKEAFELVRNNLGNANFFSFGIGRSVNRYLIEGLASVGRAESFVVSSAANAKKAAVKFRKQIETPVLSGIDLKFSGLNVFDLDPKKAPDMFSERPLVVTGKWRGNPEGEVTITGFRGGENYKQTIPLSENLVSKNRESLKYLWARRRVAELSDFNRVVPGSELQTEITALGLAYNILTEFTSFVAVDSEVRNPGGISQRSIQPLPMPKGVSRYAVPGGRSGGGIRFNRYPSSRSSGAQSFSGNRSIAPATTAVQSYQHAGAPRMAVYNDDRIASSANVLLMHVEGSFGMLLMMIFGVTGILILAFSSHKQHPLRWTVGVLCILLAAGVFLGRGVVGTFFNDYARVISGSLHG